MHAVTLTIPLKKDKNKKKRGRGSSSGDSEPQTKKILHNVAGEAPAGAVTAIMGPTGACVRVGGDGGAVPDSLGADRKDPET